VEGADADAQEPRRVLAVLVTDLVDQAGGGLTQTGDPLHPLHPLLGQQAHRHVAEQDDAAERVARGVLQGLGIARSRRVSPARATVRCVDRTQDD
jgi:hypothetical protein